jgi:hypothetical protein
MSVTAAAASPESIMIKDKKTTIIIMKDVKTKIFKHRHHGKLFKHNHKNSTMSGRNGKKNL